MSTRRHSNFSCPCSCGRTFYDSRGVRIHTAKVHPEITQLQMERHILDERYPDADIDALIQSYVDKKDTVWTLAWKGYKLSKFIRMSGLLRSYGEDITLQRKFKHGSVSPHDNPNMKKALMEKYGVENVSHCPEINDKKIMTRLKNEGLEELYPAAKALNTIKKIKKLNRKIKKEAAEQKETQE